MLIDSTHKKYNHLLESCKGIKASILASGSNISRPTAYNFLSGKPIQFSTLSNIEDYLETKGTKEKSPVHDIQMLRRYLGKSQDQVAIDLGISQSTLSRLETNGISEDSIYYPHYLKLLDQLGDLSLYQFLDQLVDKYGANNILLKIRTMLKMSQTQFAKAIDTSQPYLSQMEGGTRPITLAKLNYYVSVLKLTKEQLYKIIAKKNLTASE